MLLCSEYLQRNFVWYVNYLAFFFFFMQQTFKNSFKNYFIAFQMLLKNFSLYI